VKKNLTNKTLGIVFVILALSVSLQGCASEKDNQSANDEIQISFKLDARLFGPTYGGERWVPPPYGPIAYSGIYTLEAQAYHIDSVGRQTAITAEWIPADPNLVTVLPGEGSQVAITVLGIGETTLMVKTSQGSKTLYIKATAQNDVVQLVKISQ